MKEINLKITDSNIDFAIWLCYTVFIEKVVTEMPELCRFKGIIIKMQFNDTVQHNKPHVHVIYGEYKATIGIDGELLAGKIPYKQLKMVVGWLAFYEKEVYAAWNKAVRGEHFDRINSL